MNNTAPGFFKASFLGILLLLTFLLSASNLAATRTTRVWEIYNSNDWADLKTYLPEAKITNTDILIVLLPPSQCPPIDPSGNYSEPYRLDFLTWAQQIGDLSLRYSNIKGYYIKDVQENIDLGYLTQTYVNSVGNESNSINSRLQFITVNPSHYYVDKNASGNGNGSSWTNAATSLSALDWSNIGKQVNDTVFISGGTDTTKYAQDLLSSINPANKVVIASGKDTNHNGVVYYHAVTSSIYRTLKFSNCSNLKIVGIEAVWDKTAPDNNNVVTFSSCSNVTMDSCKVITNGYMMGILINGCDHISLLYNTIIGLPNTSLNGQDAIWIGYGTGGHTLKGNIINLARFYDPSLPHLDGIQMYNEGGSNLTTTIADNFIYKEGQCIYISGVNSNRFLIYNNILIDTTHSTNGGKSVVTVTGTGVKAELYNNDIISYGETVDGNSVGFSFGYLDSLSLKNNIFYSDNGGRSIYYFFKGLSNIGYKNIDYNRYFQGSNVNGRIDTTTITSGITFSKWQTLGYDSHSSFGTVSFANLWGTDKTDYKLSSGQNQDCIDKGIPISLFDTDIEGTQRPQGNGWDKGALEQ